MKNKLQKIINVARGIEDGDLILKNGTVFNTISGEIYVTDVIISGDKIAGIGEYDKAEKIIDVSGKFIIPGFIDGHVHAESSMVSLEEFSRTLISRGVTTAIVDPHELANVAGESAIEYFISESEKLMINLFIMLPSCVPATDFETSGAEFRKELYEKYIGNKNVLGLAEMMNYPGVIYSDENTLEKIMACQGKLIDGHAPMLSGKDLCAYIASGVTSEHECITAKEALEKLRLGMYIMLREGSASKNLKDLLPLVNKFNSQRCFLSTDDRHPDDLLNEGSIDHMVRMIIDQTSNAMRAVRMASFNAAEYYGLKKLGAIAPGKLADILIVDDIKKLNIVSVIKSGNIVYDTGKFLIPRSFEIGKIQKKFPRIFNSMNVKDFDHNKLMIPAEDGKIRVIEIEPEQIITKCKEYKPLIKNGFVVSDIKHDILKICVVERHKGTGNIGLGFVKGFGLYKGAIATTIAHDSHNIIAVGTDDNMIFKVIKKIIAIGGGVTLFDGNKFMTLPLQIGGLMSVDNIDIVSAKLIEIREMIKSLGCELSDPLMQLSFLALPVIPELKITDQGLFDSSNFKKVSLWSK